MKLPSLLGPLKSIKKHIKGTRLIVVLAIVTVLVVGAVSVSAYTISQQKNKQPVAEKAQSNPPTPVPKQESAAPAKEEKPTAESTSPEASNATVPVPRPTTTAPVAKQPSAPRRHTSEDPAFVICTQKYSDLYVKFNADLDTINAEKNLALATLDELYDTGYYAEQYPEEAEYNHYNLWQMDRAELVEHYNSRLSDLNRTHEAESSVYLNC